MKSFEELADVCLILEGTYPFVTGGVSSWTHDLLCAQKDIRFHLLCLLPPKAEMTPRYALPSNIVSLTTVTVGQVPKSGKTVKGLDGMLRRLEPHLQRVLAGGALADIAAVLSELRAVGDRAGNDALLNSPEAWNLVTRMYDATHAGSAFLDYFWTWRALLSGLYSMLLCPIPPARLYHPLCTGYAGLFAARAHVETGRPVILTEHGIYTNERRIEIGMADWLHEARTSGLQPERSDRELKDLWMDSFATYSRACYEAASQIITLFEGNQRAQLEDGADSAKLMVIPNGIDVRKYSAVVRDDRERRPAVALIGRVVPIKDVKTFLRAVGILRGAVPDIQALVLGPVDEDEKYFHECESLVRHLGLDETVTFTGRVALADYLGRIDLMVLTSISEAQPLVILEAGAAGVPSVATDVGACREMIYGHSDEPERFGAAGEVVPLADPVATAEAMARLLLSPSRLKAAQDAVRARVTRYYDKPGLDAAYAGLYRKYTHVSV